LIRVADGGVTKGEYTYNANGQRAIKATGTTTIYHYDLNGQLIAETGADGTIFAEYVYLIGQPFAKIDASGVSYIHTDHLGTPVMMSNASGVKIWEIEAMPFGDHPTITGTAKLNIRFPGQYYDAETGLNYNYFRDYRSDIGRYIEADLIGLEEGINLYIYVDNPVSHVDYLGGVLSIGV
jgi:RHS repeat-associated protein